MSDDLKSENERLRANLDEIWEAFDEQINQDGSTRVECMVRAAEEYVEIVCSLPDNVAMCDDAATAVRALAAVYETAEQDEEEKENALARAERAEKLLAEVSDAAVGYICRGQGKHGSIDRGEEERLRAALDKARALLEELK